jgi:hypothetical protein
MPDVLSADRHIEAGDLPRPSALDVPPSIRLRMVVLGFIPALHLAAAMLPVALALTGRVSPAVAWLAPVVLVFVPPLAVRLATTWTPLPTGLVQPGSGAFLHWWFTAQWQIVFARLPAIEELMRMIPGLYSVWLRLWGARVGGLVYWSPGVVILDRSLVRIGSRVIVGTAARLNPHALAPVGPRNMGLYLAPITIGDDVLIGASSQLLPGCEIACGAVTPPFRSIHAFSRFVGGQRMRQASEERVK